MVNEVEFRKRVVIAGKTSRGGKSCGGGEWRMVT